VRSSGVSLATLAALNTQIYTYEQLFADLKLVLESKMNELQREANREFTPTIAHIMHTVYDRCSSGIGPGQYNRMKKFMTDTVDHGRHNMFNDATLTIKRHLDDVCRALEDVMEEKADEIFIKMKANCK
jgi:hypothetical protein